MGLNRKKVQLEEHNPAWKKEYENEKVINSIQEKFFKEIRMAQEETVFSALNESCSTESLLFNVTYDKIFKLLEIFDGYRNTQLNLDIINKENSISINPHKNLHDLCAEYLKTDENK